MRISKTCLKQSFFYSKWVLQAILSLTVLSNCVSGSSNLTLLFSLTVPNFVLFFGLFNRKFNEDFKNVLKTDIFLLQVNFTGDFVTDFQTVFLAVQTLTLLFSLTVPNFVLFFRLLDRKFNEDFKNVLKTSIFLLQVNFTGNFVTDCSFKVCVLTVQTLTLLFSLTVPNFVLLFQVIE